MNTDFEEHRLVEEAQTAIKYANSAFFNSIETQCLYHYSTIEALFNGILVRNPESENKAISLFATDHRYLNDDKEIRHGCKIMRDIVKKYFRLDFDDDSEIFKDTERAYIISFSKEKDCIPMWSTYGNRGDGIALGFDASVLEASLGAIAPCLYSDKDVKKYLMKVLTKLEEYNSPEPTQGDMSALGFRLGYVTCSMIPQLKNEFYRYEKEIRFCSRQEVNIGYRYRKNLIIPYSLQYLPRIALKKIILGPDLNFEKTKQSIQEYIKSIGFVDVEIIKSNAPFRNL